MADIKISQLSSIQVVNDADVFPIVSGGVTSKVSAGNFKKYTIGNTDNSELGNDVGEQIQTLKNLIKAVTPDKYGAIGDGTTDDTESLQNAINDSFILYLPQGKEYKVSALEVPKGRSIVGEGTIVLSASSMANGIVMLGNNTISGITVTDDYQEYDTSHSAIYGNEVEGCTISNVKLEDVHLAYAIRLDKSAQCSITYNRIVNYAYSGIMLVNGCHHVDIENNYVYNSRFPQSNNCYPISISGFFVEAWDCARYIKCNYNYIEELSPVWEGIDSHGVVNCEVAYNTIKGTSRGMVFGNGPTSGNAIPENNKNIYIHHNYVEFDNGTTYGVGIIVTTDNRSVDGKCENVVIDSNTIKALHATAAHTAGTSCITAQIADGEMTSVEITNNTIIAENDGITIGGYRSGEIGKVKIDGNDISGGKEASYSAIHIEILIPFDIVDVTNNNIHDCVNGVDIKGFPTNAGTSMITYHGNKDNNRYTYSEFITTPKAAFNTSLAAGKCGDFVPSTASDSSAGWFCKSAGNWIAV